MGAKPWYDWVFRWRRAWDSNPRTVFGRQTISSRSRYDLFDSPPYISTVFRALRKCKKNTQEQYEILKFDPAKTLINQGFSAEKTARANAHFESGPLWPLRYASICDNAIYSTLLSAKKQGYPVAGCEKRKTFLQNRKKGIDYSLPVW